MQIGTIKEPECPRCHSKRYRGDYTLKKMICLACGYRSKEDYRKYNRTGVFVE